MLTISYLSFDIRVFKCALWTADFTPQFEKINDSKIFDTEHVMNEYPVIILTNTFKECRFLN